MLMRFARNYSFIRRVRKIRRIRGGTVRVSLMMYVSLVIVVIEVESAENHWNVIIVT